MKTPGSKSVVEDASDGGFAARYRKTSLLEWIGLIELGHRDALINLETEDGRKGRIWCVAGDIVDAQCGNLTGPEAVDELLSLPGGDFSVTFDQVDRSRSIRSSTSAYLVDAALAREQKRTAAYSGAPVAHSNPPERPGGARPNYVAIAISTFATALGVSLYLAAPPAGVRAPASHAEQATSKSPEASMLVHVEVDPSNAEIWFDGKRVAIGYWHQVIGHDNRTHELRFSSPGYIPQRLIFLDAAPSRHMTLERIVDSRVDQNAPVNLEEQHQLADLERAAKEPTVSNEAKRARPVEAGRARRAPPAPPLLRRVPTDSDPPSPLATWYDVEAQKPRPIVESAKPKIRITEP